VVLNKSAGAPGMKICTAPVKPVERQHVHGRFDATVQFTSPTLGKVGARFNSMRFAPTSNAAAGVPRMGPPLKTPSDEGRSRVPYAQQGASRRLPRHSN